MRSRIETLESIARAVTVLALGALLWRVWSPEQEGGSATADSDALGGSLARWSTMPAPKAILLRLARVPDAGERDWLAALERTGSALEWRGELEPLGIEVSTTAEPRPWYVVRVAGAAGRVRMEDGARELADLANARGAATVRTSSLIGPVTVASAGAVARAAAMPPPATRRVAVIGAAGWETKFVVAALEESGWNVTARMLAAPGVSIGSLAPSSLDTTGYSVAVILDPPGADWVSAAERFVRSGGGLIVTARAASSRELAAIVGAQPGRILPARDTTVVSRATLGVRTLQPAARSAALDHRGGAITVAAVRSGGGRALLSGYDETWRWRMQGGENGVEEHRDWWSSLAGAVAYVPRDAARATAAESAPLAHWIATAGPPSGRYGSDADRSGLPWNPLLYGIAAVALLLEIVSRRQRGLA